MSEQPEGPPLTPAELRQMEEIIRGAGSAPDMMSVAIDTMAAIHVQWYRAWQAHGAPEHRAAEWTGIMVGTMFRIVP